MLVPGSFPTALNVPLPETESERLRADIALGWQDKHSDCGLAAVLLLSDVLASSRMPS